MVHTAALVGSGGQKKPCSPAACWSASLVTPGSTSRQAVLRIDRQDARHALEGENDAAAVRDRGPGGARTQAARGNGDALAIA